MYQLWKLSQTVWRKTQDFLNKPRGTTLYIKKDYQIRHEDSSIIAFKKKIPPHMKFTADTTKINSTTGKNIAYVYV